MSKAAEAKVKAMPTPELLTLYNSLTGKSIKKFSSRANGEKQTLAALTAKAATAAKADTPKAEATAAAPAAARKVSLMGVKMGRPKSDYGIQVIDGAASKLRPSSMRSMIVNHMNAQPNRSCTISALTEKFGDAVHGAVVKLLSGKHVRRTDGL